jgi:hypothetical protein
VAATRRCADALVRKGRVASPGGSPKHASSYLVESVAESARERKGISEKRVEESERECKGISGGE